MDDVLAQPQAAPASNFMRFWRTLGPGLLWAAAAIGVSHLVQSTRAGADGGFSLVWVVLLALVVKYPFFEYGPRYAAATGESLIEGYFRLGRWAVYTYLVITLASALIIQSAIVLFTAFVLAHALNLDWSMAACGAAILITCAGLLWFGRFKALDRTIKSILLVLAICTILAAATTLPRAADATFTPWPLADTPAVHWIFILALVGWMPSAIDIAVWSSLWTLAKNKASGVKASMGEVLLDFRIGYFVTGLIALAFLTLGATVMYMADERFSVQGAAFSLQLVDLFSASLGAWARPVILIAVLTTMFSTSLTVIDGLPRAIERSVLILKNGLPESLVEEFTGRVYWITLAVLAALTLVILTHFVGSLTSLVDFATLVAFTTGPVLGYLNLKAVTMSHVSKEHQPGRSLKIFSYAGILLMIAVAFIFLLSRTF